NMRYLPTLPLELARPWGNRLDADASSSRGVSAPLAARMNALARWACSRPSASQYSARVTRPAASVSSRWTVLSARISHRPVASARGIIVASVEDFAPTSQPYIMQKPQWMQTARPAYGRERMAIGAGNAFQPSLRAPCSSNTPEDFTGSGGSG